MAVRPETLDTPERGMSLRNRDGREVDISTHGTGPRLSPAVAELKALRERIDAARAAKPHQLAPDEMRKARAQCLDCATKGYRAGWLAALDAIEQG